MDKQASKRSSFFTAARKSFYRSSGERGASVDTLRGTHGADFEGAARLKRVGESGGCSCIFGGGGKTDKTEKFVIMKGPFCFVFQSEASTSPLYAISLVDMKTDRKGAVALLQTTLGDTAYEFSFSDEDQAANFCEKANALALSGRADEIRKQLGHAHLLHHTKSIKFAEAIAQKKVDDQPSAPFSNQEIMASIPVGGI